MRGLILQAEKDIVHRAVAALFATGYAVTVFDGEEDVITVEATCQHYCGTSEHSLKAVDAVMGALVNPDGTWATDDAVLHATPYQGQNKGLRKGWIALVFGNGPDVISDYTTNLEETLKPVTEYADSLN